MSDLLVRPQIADSSGRVTHITPVNANWKYVGFDLYHLQPGQTLQRDTGENEQCLVAVSGSMDISTGKQSFDNLGGRQSPFEDKAPGALYLPVHSNYQVTAKSVLELAVCSAPGSVEKSVSVIDEQEMSREIRGQGTNTRHIRNILPDTDLRAHSLLVVEVITPSGHWSSYPPHKHDQDDLPIESYLEETYYHRLDPTQGFAFQRIYTDDRSLDETLCVQDGDVVKVPRGYHPVGAPHGYQLYYLNVMAGPTRKWVFQNDPQHEWIIR